MISSYKVRHNAPYDTKLKFGSLVKYINDPNLTNFWWWKYKNINDFWNKCDDVRLMHKVLVATLDLGCQYSCTYDDLEDNVLKLVLFALSVIKPKLNKSAFKSIENYVRYPCDKTRKAIEKEYFFKEKEVYSAYYVSKFDVIVSCKNLLYYTGKYILGEIDIHELFSCIESVYESEAFDIDITKMFESCGNYYRLGAYRNAAYYLRKREADKLRKLIPELKFC